MGSQKVPRMAVLRCDGTTCGNAYLITFKVGPLCTYTRSIDPATVGSTGGRLLLESSRARPSHSIWCPPRIRKTHFQSREQPKVTRSKKWRVRWFGDERNVCLAAELLNKLCVSRWVVMKRRPLSMPLHNLCKNFHVEMTSNTLSRWYELMVHQTVNVKGCRELFWLPLIQPSTT
jgi:hypothetical protein